MVITTLVSRECKEFFNLVYIIDFTEKGYTVPTEFRDHFVDPSRSAITEPTKMDSN